MSDQQKNINFLEGHISNIPSKEQFHHICGLEGEDFEI
jgi:3-dehydroquinate dehydratase